MFPTNFDRLLVSFSSTKFVEINESVLVCLPDGAPRVFGEMERTGRRTMMKKSIVSRREYARICMGLAREGAAGVDR